MSTNTGVALSLVDMTSECMVTRANRAAIEARTLATEVTNKLLLDLLEIASRCDHVSGFEALPPGQRDVLRRLGERIAADARTVTALGLRR